MRIKPKVIFTAPLIVAVYFCLFVILLGGYVFSELIGGIAGWVAGQMKKTGEDLDTVSKWALRFIDTKMGS